MKIELKSPILWDGQHQPAGTILDVSETHAYNLIGRGRAVKFVEPAPNHANTDRSVGLETSDGQKDVVKRAYKRKPKASE
ncbi:MAG: hypothetical protein RI531_07370 [Haloferacaceae archaeon]|nr:hypothetical protein [Haloferacaceae archaeon]